MQDPDYFFWGAGDVTCNFNYNNFNLIAFPHLSPTSGPVLALGHAWSRNLSSSKMAEESKNKRFRNEPRNTLSCYAIRLKPGQEVIECLLKYVRDKKLEAPFVLSCVGSVTQATLRLADAARDTPNEVSNPTLQHSSFLMSEQFLMPLPRVYRLKQRVQTTFN